VSVAEQNATISEELNPLQLAREVLATEAAALQVVRDRLDESFCRAAVLVHAAAVRRGSVIVTGMGKAGLVGQKIAATLASTGTRAHSLHPAEAVHGDLGRISAGDVVLAFSYSGETDEVVRLIGPIRKIGAQIVAVTAREYSRLARNADVAIVIGPIEEACPMKLAPSASTTAMMAVGDALAFVVSRMRNFQPENFAEFHPGGNLGRLTATVEEVMRTGDQLRIAHFKCTVREALVESHRHGRRTGALLLVDDDGVMRGIFTDADLARLLEQRRDADLDRPIAALMNMNPTVIPLGTVVRDAITILSSRKFSQLPVLDTAGRPVGVLDITDLIGLVPQANAADGDEKASRAAA
jgi:arabinose-5-phosphate isomerase